MTESTPPPQYTFRRTRLEAHDFAWLQSVVDEGGYLQDVAVKACRRFGWVRPNGEPPVAACSTMLRRLEERGLLRVSAPPRLFSGAARHVNTALTIVSASGGGQEIAEAGSVDAG